MKSVDKDPHFIYDHLISLTIMASIVFQGGYFPIQYLTTLAMMCILAFIQIHKRRRAPMVLNRPVLAFATGFVLFHISSTLWVATDKYAAVLETLKVVGFLLMLLLAGFVQEKKVIFKGVFYGCFILALAGILFYVDIFYFPNAVLKDGNLVRLQSFLQYANTTALFMGIGFFVCIYFAQIGEKEGIKSTIKHWVYSYIFLVAFILTLSRGTLAIFFVLLIPWLYILKSYKITMNVMVSGAAAFLCAFFMNKLVINKEYEIATFLFAGSLAVLGGVFYGIEKYFKPQKKHVFFLAGILVIPVVGALVFGLGGMRRILRFSFFEGTLIERWVYVQDGMMALWENPVLGIGPDNWKSQQFLYQTAQYYSHYIHNGFTQFALNAGIVSVLCFTGILVVYYRQGVLQWKKERDMQTITSLFIVTLIAGHSMIDVDLSFSSVLLVLAAFISVVLSGSKEKGMMLTHRGTRWAGTAGVSVLFSVALFYLAGQVTLMQAENEYRNHRIGRAEEMYRVSCFLRPFDGDPYLGLARCSRERQAGFHETKKFLEKAHSLDAFRSEYLKEYYQFASEAEEFKEAYDVSVKLMEIEPLNVENYKGTLSSLQRLKEKGLIDMDELEGRAEEVAKKAEKANGKITVYSKYLRHQEPITVGTELNKIKE